MQHKGADEDHFEVAVADTRNWGEQGGAYSPDRRYRWRLARASTRYPDRVTLRSSAIVLTPTTAGTTGAYHHQAPVERTKAVTPRRSAVVRTG